MRRIAHRISVSGSVARPLKPINVTPVVGLSVTRSGGLLLTPNNVPPEKASPLIDGDTDWGQACKNTSSRRGEQLAAVGNKKPGICRVPCRGEDFTVRSTTHRNIGHRISRDIDGFHDLDEFPD